MLRSLAVSVLPLLAFAAAPAQAQKQEYQPWVYEQMVPTGPYLRNLDQAQPVPGARPSHWGAVGKNGEFRAGMRQYGTDPRAAERTYSRTQSLNPPPVDPRARPAPQTGEAPAAPRAVQID